jgi:Helix-turn-helix domain
MLKLCLLTLRTFMDRDGYAYPSQETIAKGASVSEKTAQRKLDTARKLGWLHVETRGRTGQGWKLHGYRCCIPDHIAVGAPDQRIIDGKYEERPEPQRGRSGYAGAERPEPQRGRSAQTSGTSGHDAPKVSPGRPEPEGDNVPSDVPTKSSFSSLHVSHQEGARARHAVLTRNESDDDSDAVDPTALAAALADVGVAVTPSHPTLIRWATDGVTVERALGAVAVARERKPAPQSIPLAYLDPIIREPPRETAADAMRRAIAESGINEDDIPF